MADEFAILIAKSVALPGEQYTALQHLAFVCAVPEDNLVRAILHSGINKLADRCRDLPEEAPSSARGQAQFAEHVHGILVDEFGIDGSIPDEDRRIKHELDRLEQAFERDGY